jgi:hypothetical protein
MPRVIHRILELVMARFPSRWRACCGGPETTGSASGSTASATGAAGAGVGAADGSAVVDSDAGGSGGLRRWCEQFGLVLLPWLRLGGRLSRRRGRNTYVRMV